MTMAKVSFPALTLGVIAVLGQSTGATFGDVIRLGGTPSDIVLDEARGRPRQLPRPGGSMEGSRSAAPARWQGR